MTPQPQQQKEPTCTIKCPAIRDDKETWYCQIRRECVSPLEHHFEYGFDIVRCGKITHSGYSTPCNAIKLFRSRSAPSQPECTIDDVMRMDQQIRYAQRQAAAQAREDAMVEIVEELHRQFIGRTKSQILDIMCECQINPGKWLKSLRTGGDE